MTPAPNGSGNDGIIAWNRWVAPGPAPGHRRRVAHSQSDDERAGMHFHYVIGVPTPQADMDALRTANVTATYDFLGATLPTSRNGNPPGSTLGALLPSSNLVVNFGTSQVTATLFVQTALATLYQRDRNKPSDRGFRLFVVVWRRTVTTVSSQNGGCPGMQRHDRRVLRGGERGARRRFLFDRRFRRRTPDGRRGSVQAPGVLTLSLQ